jgi:ribonuclease BN (tRNA processing enzyme)
MSHVRFVGCGDAFGSGGRFNTCILVDVPSCRFAIDFGASSLIALKAQGIDHNSISTIICTHIHGDHCGGVPFLLMDAMLGAKRTAPLTIAGPKGIHAGILAMRDALFPGMERMIPKFDLEFVEIETASERSLGPINVTTDLPPNFHPVAVRVSGVCTPAGAVGATGDRRSWSGLRSRSSVAVNAAA